MKVAEHDEPPPPYSPEDLSTVASCAEELSRLFSLEHLTSDPYMLFHMSPELWIPIKAVMLLESVVKITRSRKIVKQAISSLGYEYDHFIHMFRPDLKVPRTEVVVRNAPSEDIQEFIGQAVDISKEEDYLVLRFLNEEEALAAAESMISSGYLASIDSVDPYCYVQSKVLKTMPEMVQNSILNRLFFTGTQKNHHNHGNTYSRDELLNIFLQMSPNLQRPDSLQLFQNFPIVSDKPNVTLENLKTGRVQRSHRPQMLPRSLRTYRLIDRS